MNAPPTAIVTGGCAGIGLHISQLLAAEGYRVIAADIAAGDLDGSESPAPFAIQWLQLDVGDWRAVRQEFDQIVDTVGSIDVLVNNAGIQRHGALEDLTADEWSDVVRVNLNGVFNCLQSAGRHMLHAGRGAVVNIASVAARGAAGRAPYAATKAAVIALTATAGAEWASRGVRVNAVAPGYVDTGVFRQGVAAGTLEPAAILSRIPASRLAGPDEIAKVVRFLASEDAGYINGQTVYVDGGFMVDYGVPLAGRPHGGPQL